MDARFRSVCLFLLATSLALPSCQQLPEPRDARLVHARESTAWRDFDAGVDALHRARRTMREGFVLPERPALRGAAQEATWAAAAAAEQNVLADLTLQDALNDLEHQKQAVELAERQVAASRARAGEALARLQPAMRRLQQVLREGDVDANLRAVEHLAARLPSVYRGVVLGVARDVRSQPRRE